MAESTESDFAVLCTGMLFPWWIILLWGLLTLILGGMFLATPALTVEMLIVFLGAFWLVGGLFSLGSLLIDRSNMGWKIFLAVINILAGGIILLQPFFASLFILFFSAVFIGFFACFIGCSHLFQAFRAKDAGNGVLGIISLIFGILLLVNPFLSAAMLPFIAGAFCIVSGISAIITSFMAKKALAAVQA